MGGLRAQRSYFAPLANDNFQMAQHVYEKIIESGQEYGLLHAGYYTLRHLRIEKFYVYWGQDIDASTTPVECGRTFRVDFKVLGCSKSSWAFLKTFSLNGITLRNLIGFR